MHTRKRKILNNLKQQIADISEKDVKYLNNRLIKAYIRINELTDKLKRKNCYTVTNNTTSVNVYKFLRNMLDVVSNGGSINAKTLLALLEEHSLIN